ncbi:hypothetical protein CDAR_399931 [Caerostris darwini]|uniref:Uncharacterized protein n=1 Tax=Caerostris darwini TaxID=1538125 RepID=A0AAV4S7K9_9ARAC|nr:hypothetical protein CDAR_399931 [Caerostris darwini]
MAAGSSAPDPRIWCRPPRSETVSPRIIRQHAFTSVGKSTCREGEGSAKYTEYKLRKGGVLSQMSLTPEPLRRRILKPGQDKPCHRGSSTQQGHLSWRGDFSSSEQACLHEDDGLPLE